MLNDLNLKWTNFRWRKLLLPINQKSIPAFESKITLNLSNQWLPLQKIFLLCLAPLGNEDNENCEWEWFWYEPVCSHDTEWPIKVGLTIIYIYEYDAAFLSSNFSLMDSATFLRSQEFSLKCLPMINVISPDEC